MPRNIIFPDEQENEPVHLAVPCKNGEKRNSTSSNFSDEEPIMIDTKWRTNLLIPNEGERVQKRKQGYRKNTSFQNKIINSHIQVMIESVCEMEETHLMAQCQHICGIVSIQQGKSKQGIVHEKVSCLVQDNTYLTEQEKHEFLPLFTTNFDNYQILIKTTTRLQSLGLLTEELTFMLLKIVQFISTHYEVNSKKYDREFLSAQVEDKLGDVIKSITDHQNVRLINPEYFYNHNEGKFLRIIERWFYTVFAIKSGISFNKYFKGLNEVEEMELQM